MIGRGIGLVWFSHRSRLFPVGDSGDNIITDLQKYRPEGIHSVIEQHICSAFGRYYLIDSVSVIVYMISAQTNTCPCAFADDGSYLLCRFISRGILYGFLFGNGDRLFVLVVENDLYSIPCGNIDYIFADCHSNRVIHKVERIVIDRIIGLDGEFAVCVVPIKDLAVFMTSCESDHFGFLSTVAEHCLDCIFRRIDAVYIVAFVFELVFQVDPDIPIQRPVIIIIIGNIHLSPCFHGRDRTTFIVCVRIIAVISEIDIIRL